jgi:hypothetical protein
MTLPSSNSSSSSSSSSGGVPVPHKLCPGDVYSYWRWAAALTFALADVAPPTEGTLNTVAAQTTAYNSFKLAFLVLEDCALCRS